MQAGTANDVHDRRGYYVKQLTAVIDLLAAGILNSDELDNLYDHLWSLRDAINADRQSDYGAKS